MFRIPEVFDSVFYNTHTTIPLQDISVRRKHYIKFGCTTIGLDFWFLSKTTANRVPFVPTPNLCTTNLMDSSNSFRFRRSLGIPLHEFHREAPSIFRLYLNPSHC